MTAKKKKTGWVKPQNTADWTLASCVATFSRSRTCLLMLRMASFTLETRRVHAPVKYHVPGYLGTLRVRQRLLSRAGSARGGRGKSTSQACCVCYCRQVWGRVLAVPAVLGDRHNGEIMMPDISGLHTRWPCLPAVEGSLESSQGWRVQVARLAFPG